MSTPTETYRVAPPGFTEEQWETFDRDGIIFIENAISDEDVERYKAALDQVCAESSNFDPNEAFTVNNCVERHPDLPELIDHERHVGFAYDLFGELLKLHESQFHIRPPGGKLYNIWHPDGARALPYGVFSKRLPLQIKIGYWLTDVPEPKMGNLTVIPGSQREQYNDHYDTHESDPREQVVCVKRGTMTVMHSSIWHRVEPNQSEVTRKNVFVAYCPAWITNSDRLTSDPDWLATLNREQRIIMRSYTHAYDNAKPPGSEFPLFLDRETGSDRDEGKYRDHVRLNRRKRITQAEKFLARELNPA